MAPKAMAAMTTALADGDRSTGHEDEGRGRRDRGSRCRGVMDLATVAVVAGVQVRAAAAQAIAAAAREVLAAAVEAVPLAAAATGS